MFLRKGKSILWGRASPDLRLQAPPCPLLGRYYVGAGIFLAQTLGHSTPEELKVLVHILTYSTLHC